MQQDPRRLIWPCALAWIGGTGSFLLALVIKGVGLDAATTGPARGLYEFGAVCVLLSALTVYYCALFDVLYVAWLLGALYLCISMAMLDPYKTAPLYVILGVLAPLSAQRNAARWRTIELSATAVLTCAYALLLAYRLLPQG